MRYDGEFHEQARTLAEAIYEAYAQQATAPAHKLAEQTVVTRLVEALEPLAGGPADALVSAANAVLDDWELRDAEVRGPRVSALDLAGPRVTLRPR